MRSTKRKVPTNWQWRQSRQPNSKTIRMTNHESKGNNTQTRRMKVRRQQEWSEDKNWTETNKEWRNNTGLSTNWTRWGDELQVERHWERDSANETDARWVWHCKWWFHISKTNLSSWVHLSSLFGSLVLWFSSITSSLGSSRHRQLPSGAETKTRTKSMLENTHPTWAAVHQIHLKGEDVSK